MRDFFAAVKLLLTLHCDQSSRLISKGLDEELSSVERWAVRLHFISCKPCRQFRKQMEFVRFAAQQLAATGKFQIPDDMELSPEARQRIAAAIQNAQE